MRKKVNCIKKLQLGFFPLLLRSNNKQAQKQYQIDISKQHPNLVKGFIKTGTNISPSGEKLSYNNSFLTKNDKPWFPVFGKIHYSRTNEKDWEGSILKMKSGGIDVISTYVIWNLHEETENQFEWNGNKDLGKFLALCQKHQINDSNIGSDLFGQIDNRVRNSYPKLGAELGGGMQVTYHRSVGVSEKDIAAVAHSRIAGRLNGLGYYMYHGGMNPVGKTTFQESRLTVYPNDVTIINYDFQAPIGSMGLTSKSYKELRLMHTFLMDFSSILTTQNPYFPAVRTAPLFSKDAVKSSIRMKDKSGFIFLYNYQRHMDLPTINNFQLQITNKKETITVPEKPTPFPANTYCICPYNFQMDNILVYDQFNYNNNCKIKMSELNNHSAKDLVVQILPFKTENDIYVQDNTLEEKKGLNTNLKAVTMKPVLRFELKMATK